MNEQSPQLGLLDLSVDLSVPEVYSGTDFTVYLHIKNPFAIPVWVRSVELSLPTQLEWRFDSRWASASRLRDHRLLRDFVSRLVKCSGSIGRPEESIWVGRGISLAWALR